MLGVGDGVSAIASLAVTFGGFSPTAMDGVAGSKEQIERMEAEYARKKEQARKLRELEYARSSEPRQHVEDDGTVWTYRVVDGMSVRIVRCVTSRRSLAFPEALEGLPVYALGAEVCSENELVEEIYCPDNIEVIGKCAFRLCPNLKSVRFPDGVTEFSGSWVTHCPNLQEIVLPGLLVKIESSVFENASLKKLVIGKAVREIAPGAFEKSQLNFIDVSRDNPYISCDGDAIYSKDGHEFLALARPVERYVIREGCRRLAKKACMGIASLSEVTAPASLEELGDYAFAHTAIKRFTCPENLHVIGERAFFHCKELASVKLNEGLGEVRSYAFAESGIEGIFLPASVRQLGNCLAENSNVEFSGEACSFMVAEDNPIYFYDGNGGLYKRAGDHLRFVQLVDPTKTEFEIAAGTGVVESYSFAFHDSIERVVIPEGVTEVGSSAFRICRRLAQVVFPNTLEAIGKEAFFDTSLVELEIPASLRTIGKDALVTLGAHHLVEPPSLQRVKVAEGNPAFYVESGVLCQRGQSGDRAILFDNSVEDVTMPEGVTHIESYAFSNCRGIRTIHLRPNLKTIDTSGLYTWSFIEYIRVDLAEPLEGRTTYEFRFPNTSRSVHEIGLALGGSSWVNVPEMVRHYDNCLANAHDYNARGGDGVSAYEQARLVIGRLKDPVMLSNVNRSLFERTLRLNIIEICVDTARHDDRRLIDDFVDFGFINDDNIEDAVIAVSRLQDAAMSGYMLELKRLRFARDAFDFDL